MLNNFDTIHHLEKNDLHIFPDLKIWADKLILDSGEFLTLSTAKKAKILNQTCLVLFFGGWPKLSLSLCEKTYLYFQSIGKYKYSHQAQINMIRIYRITKDFEAAKLLLEKIKDKFYKTDNDIIRLKSLEEFRFTQSVYAIEYFKYYLHEKDYYSLFNFSKEYLVQNSSTTAEAVLISSKYIFDTNSFYDLYNCLVGKWPNNKYIYDLHLYDKLSMEGDKYSINKIIKKMSEFWMDKYLILGPIRNIYANSLLHRYLNSEIFSDSKVIFKTLIGKLIEEKDELNLFKIFILKKKIIGLDNTEKSIFNELKLNSSYKIINSSGLINGKVIYKYFNKLLSN